MKEIEDLFTDKKITSICKNIGGHLWQDLRQECIVIILAYDKEKLSNAISGGYLKQLFVRIMATQCNGSHSEFFRTYKKRQHDELIYDIANEPDEADNTKVNESLNKFLELNESKKDWFNKELFKLYVKEGSYRKVEALTGISYGTVAIAVNKVRNEAVRRFSNQYNNG